MNDLIFLFKNLFRHETAKWAILKWVGPMRVVSLRSNEAPHQYSRLGSNLGPNPSPWASLNPSQIHTSSQPTSSQAIHLHAWAGLLNSSPIFIFSIAHPSKRNIILRGSLRHRRQDRERSCGGGSAATRRCSRQGGWCK